MLVGREVVSGPPAILLLTIVWPIVALFLTMSLMAGVNHRSCILLWVVVALGVINNMHAAPADQSVRQAPGVEYSACALSQSGTDGRPTTINRIPVTKCEYDGEFEATCYTVERDEENNRGISSSALSMYQEA